MQTLKPVDVVIIGGGWTGLAMAKELTSRTALETVVLERGPARKISDYAANMDEVDFCDPLAHDAKQRGRDDYASLDG